MEHRGTYYVYMSLIQHFNQYSQLEVYFYHDFSLLTQAATHKKVYMNNLFVYADGDFTYTTPDVLLKRQLHLYTPAPHCYPCTNYQQYKLYMGSDSAHRPEFNRSHTFYSTCF